MSAACMRCAEELVGPEKGCPWCKGERREEAVKALVSAIGSDCGCALLTRAEAIFTLRNLGHSQDEVLLARARAIDGFSAREIVEELEGKTAVAA